MIGSSISHYKIVAKLGEGGMGVVYEAEDTKLERPVALKFLPNHLLGDAEVRKRFDREAKAAAALDHANACTVYEVDEVEGKTFIAMSLIAGESLDKRIARGPLKLDEALEIAQQIAKGLEAAHKRGIVHRDIKPENIMVGEDGHVTVMDFGLAQLTQASRLTRADQTMGTTAYMSPEQTDGSGTDHRTDIWSLGVVLYEMITGQQPFKGDYDKAVMYSILNEEPEPITALRTGVPVELEIFVGKCLAKAPAKRYQTTVEIVVDLGTLADKLMSSETTIRPVMARSEIFARNQLANQPSRLPPSTQGVVPVSRLRAASAIATIFALAFLALLYLYLRPGPESLRPVTRFSLVPEGLASNDYGGSGSTVISPNGRHILYVAVANGVRSLWVRSLSAESPRRLSGTEGARSGFWSPDNSSIGFGTETELKKMSLDEGTPVTLCRLLVGGRFAFRGGTWSPDGQTIVFSSNARLYEISALGGEPKILVDTEPSSVDLLTVPYFLPTFRGAKSLIYASARNPNQVIELFEFETGERRRLGDGDEPTYSQSGHIIHSPPSDADRGLSAIPFSLESLSVTGETFPVASAGRLASVSADGTLVYLEQAGEYGLRQLVWRGRRGEVLESISQPQVDMQEPSLSPDGRSIAVTAFWNRGYDIWVHDVERSLKTRLTFDRAREGFPSWSPFGSAVAYSAIGGPIRIKPADGTGDVTVLAEAGGAPDWSQDGKYVIYQHRQDIYYVTAEPSGSFSEPTPYALSDAAERAAQFSPDGRFVAYSSNESGRFEVYVGQFPDRAGRWQISVDGGTQPRWRGDGAELYYVSGDTLMAVSVSSKGPRLVPGRPQELFQSADLVSGGSRTYDASNDGRRFLTISPVKEENVPARIRIVQNWHE